MNRTAIGNRGFVNGPTDTFRTTNGWIVTQVVGQTDLQSAGQRWSRSLRG